MSKLIIKENSDISINRDYLRKKNTTIVATYYALYAENRQRQKALVSITIGDERVESLKQYRRLLIKKINSILRRKTYRGQTIQYFTNIEMGQDHGSLTKLFNPHLHIQFFYDDIRPIEEALEHMEDKFKLTNSDITMPEKEDVNFDYVIKDYKEKNFNPLLEINKKRLYYKQALHTCSRKAIANYVIKYLYKYMAQKVSRLWNELKNYERYTFILHNIKEGHISIVSKFDVPSSKYKVVKNYSIYVDIEKLCKTSQ